MFLKVMKYRSNSVAQTEIVNDFPHCDVKPSHPVIKAVKKRAEIDYDAPSRTAFLNSA